MREWYRSVFFFASRSRVSFSFSRSLSRAALAKLAPPRGPTLPKPPRDGLGKPPRAGLEGAVASVGEGGMTGDLIAVGSSARRLFDEARRTRPLAKPVMVDSRGEEDALRSIETEPPRTGLSADSKGLGIDPSGGVLAGLVEK